MNGRDFRVSYVEEQAIHNLIDKLTANKNRLMKEFSSIDTQNTGEISMKFFVVIYLRFRSNSCQ